MILNCPYCHAVTTTAGPASPRVACPACGTLIHEDPDAQPILDAALEPCPELMLLPPALRQLSLSAGELLFTTAPALQAIDVLEVRGVLLSACHCLVGTDDRWHFVRDYPGLVRIRFWPFSTGGQRIARAARLCRATVRDHHARFSRSSLSNRERLYFSLIVGTASDPPS